MFPEVTRDDVFRIETRRLWLRWPRVQDAAAIQRLAGEKEVAEMTARIPHPYGPGVAETFIFETRKSNATGRSLVLAIADRTRPDVLKGVIGAHESEGRIEVGYWLGKPYWGKGIATEATQALVDALFTYTTVGHLDLSARVINPASRRVAEKCGFQFVGSDMADAPARGGRLAVDRFRLSRATWEGLKSWRTPRIDIDRASAEERELAACA